MKKLDVIIPAFKAHKVLPRLLGSLLTQTFKDSIKVTIVNDNCPEGNYQEIIKSFIPFLEIEEVELDTNGGPGVARQKGIDSSELDYFTFIDADDSLANPFALEKLVLSIQQEPINIMCVGTFLEEQQNLTFLKHEQDMVWVFGKVYKRSFIDKYNIRFNETRANEDNGFNTLIRLLSSETEQVKFIGDAVYYWHYKEDSITRINNAEYSYNQSFPGYEQNMVYAIQEAKKQKPFNKNTDLWAYQVMTQLYLYFYQTVERDPRFIEQNFNACVHYYNEVFFEYHDRIDNKEIKSLISSVLVQQAPRNLGVVQTETLYQFIDRLKENSDK